MYMNVCKLTAQWVKRRMLNVSRAPRERGRERGTLSDDDYERLGDVIYDADSEKSNCLMSVMLVGACTL